MHLAAKPIILNCNAPMKEQDQKFEVPKNEDDEKCLNIG